jgi:Type III restriction enzyme, res subunit
VSKQTGAGSLDYAELLAGFGSASYPSLLTAQQTVLSAYAERFSDKSDVGIELPTGAGKSLIALLVAEAWRRESKRAVVLTANKTLASQMEAHGQLLGVPISRLEGSRDDIPSPSVRVINRCQAIGVMNYWVYFNQNPVLDVADLVVMDDVHLADGALQSLFSVEITRRDHPQLFQRLADLLGDRLPGYAGVRDAANATNDPLSPSDLIAPHDHAAVIDELSAIVSGSQPRGDLGFRWSRARTHADAMHLYVTADQLVLRPYVWPLQDFPYYRDSSQRIYLSATLGNANDLQRRLGCRPVDLIPVEDTHTKPLGRRLIVLNETGDAEHPDAAIAAAIAVDPKSLWLTRSHAAVDGWRQVLQANGWEPIWQLSSNGDEATVFANARQGHLLCAGRYDGIDLPGDKCRLVIVTDLPRAVDLQEQFLSEQLRDASFLGSRGGQRRTSP